MGVLDPAVLAKLGSVQLRARAVVEGLLSGLHRSPHQGQSVEFAEHKLYTPGDELRRIDWKAFARTDRLLVKRYEHETNLRAFLVLDVSGSMAWKGGAPLTKLEYGATLIASLAHLLIRQQDAVGLVLARGDKPELLPPRAALSHLPAIVARLEATRGDGPTDLGAVAELVAERARRRAAIFVVSDLLDLKEGAIARLTDLRRRRNDVSIFQLLDPHELDFPYEDSTRFQGTEGEEELEVDPRSIRDAYLEEVGQLCSRAQQACRSADVEYELVRTDAPMDRLLLKLLARRAKG